MGRTGGGEERRDDEVTWTIGGSPIGYHNCVVRTAVSPDRADALIAASQDLMRSKGVPGSWHVGPSMRPHDLSERLSAHGFHGVSEPGMAVDLEALSSVETPKGFTVERITSEAQLELYESVLASGFGEGPPEARWVCEMFRRIGPDDLAPWRHYLGRLDGRPVASATLFFASGVAGLYFVCTAPQDRGRGIGAAISRSALVAALDLGFEVAVLGSSPMGYRIYERLGFREVCTVMVYEWSPSVSAR